MNKKPGPKSTLPPGEHAERLTITVDQMTLRKLDVLVPGNRSAAVRLAAAVAYERYQRTPEGSKLQPQ